MRFPNPSSTILSAEIGRSQLQPAPPCDIKIRHSAHSVESAWSTWRKPFLPFSRSRGELKTDLETSSKTNQNTGRCSRPESDPNNSYCLGVPINLPSSNVPF